VVGHDLARNRVAGDSENGGLLPFRGGAKARGRRIEIAVGSDSMRVVATHPGMVDVGVRGYLLLATR
jgi:hypothetical protein